MSEAGRGANAVLPVDSVFVSKTTANAMMASFRENIVPVSAKRVMVLMVMMISSLTKCSIAQSLKLLV